MISSARGFAAALREEIGTSEMKPEVKQLSAKRAQST